MDGNGDGVIARAEWRGSDQSFRFHDWNGDGRLSGDEVRLGAQPPASLRRGNSQTAFSDWTESGFRLLDRNGDNRVSRSEWRYDLEDFIRVDRNGDGFLTLSEFLIGDVDDDRGDRFDDLDLNHDNRIDRSEWHGSMEAFRWLDRNNDGVLSRSEVVGSAGPVDPGTRVRPGARIGPGARNAPGTILVNSREPWTDTGIDVRAGDWLTVRATGTIQLSDNTADIADPQGTRSRRTAGNAPLPRAPIGALIARVGNSAPFVVGASTDAIRAPRDGRLYLGVNDDFLDDNRGDFRVTISVGRQNPNVSQVGSMVHPRGVCWNAPLQDVRNVSCASSHVWRSTVM
jgi:hypothetical protein